MPTVCQKLLGSDDTENKIEVSIHFKQISLYTS